MHLTIRFILTNEVYCSFLSLDSANFQYAVMSHTNFVQTQCKMANFDHADLSMSLFVHANAKGALFIGANLTNVNFSFANLRMANFTNTLITDSQLQSALSIRDAQLPNGRLGRDPNLIKNGHASCNISVANNWQLQHGNITAVTLDTDPSNCQFASQSDVVEAIMSQKINLTLFWNTTYWKYCRVSLFARMTTGVIIQLRGMTNNRKVLDQSFLSRLKYIKHYCS